MVSGGRFKTNFRTGDRFPQQEEIAEDSEEEAELLDIMAGNHEYEYHVPSQNEERNTTVENKPLITLPRPPQDRYYVVFFIFGFLGLASLLPWNFFITAKKYFDYKLRNTSLPKNVSFDNSKYATDYQVKFESDLSIVSNGCNLFFSLITVFAAKVISVKKRIVWSSVFILIIFVATTTFVRIDTDSWQGGFLIITLVMAALMSGAQSVLTSSVLGLSAVFPFVYCQSAMIGQAAGGTFSAVVSILTHWAGGSALSSAFVYFIIAIVVTVLAILSYISLQFLKFSKFYTMSQERPVQVNHDYQLLGTEDRSKWRSYWDIFKKIWIYCLSVAITFFVTLSIFPSVCSLIKAENEDDVEWNAYFTPVVCFLLFNMGDFLGRLFTFACKFPGQRPKALIFLTILRAVFIPLLMMCNAQPRHMTVYLENDAYPVILILLMGLTNGYLGTLCMSFGPLRVMGHEAEVAGIMLAMAMTVGLAFGSFLSALLVKLL